MSEIKIEKNIPAPAGRPKKYPFAQMEVGDSFFVDAEMGTRAASSVSKARQETGFKFTCRTVEGGVRVWRIA